MTGTIDPSGVDELAGQVQEVLPHEQDAEGIGDDRHDEAGVTVFPSERLNGQPERDHHDFERQDQRDEDRPEQELAAAESVFRQTVTGPAGE